MNAMNIAGRGNRGDHDLEGSRNAASVPTLFGRKSLLIGMLTSMGFVFANAAQPSIALAGTVTYTPTWAPSTAYARGQQVVSPNNDVVAARISHTSSAAFVTDTAKWTLSSTYESGVSNLLYVAAGGDNTNHGKTQAQAKATIAGALTTLAGVAGTIRVGAGTITETTPWGVIPDGTVITGVGETLTTVTKGFSGDLATLGQLVAISSMTIDLKGAAYTGTGLSIVGVKGKQRLDFLTLKDGDGPCLYMEAMAGSLLTSFGLTAFRVNALTTTGRYAIVKQTAGYIAGARPHRFVGFSSEGSCAIDFGSCDNFYISVSTLGDLKYGPDSRAVCISASRLLNDLAMTVDGHANSIVGCDVNAQITIAPNADDLTIGPGSFNRLPVIDNSGNGRNNVTHGVVVSPTFIPVLSTSGTAPVLGNGVFVGYMSRSGSIVTVTYQLTLGSTTRLGTGELRFGLPYARGSSYILWCGQGVISTGGTSKTIAAQSIGNVDWVRMYTNDSTSPVSAVTPSSLVAGDVIRLTVNYGQ